MSRTVDRFTAIVKLIDVRSTIGRITNYFVTLNHGIVDVFTTPKGLITTITVTQLNLTVFYANKHGVLLTTHLIYHTASGLSSGWQSN